MNVQVFDKPMCCSTGICGPQVDQTLVYFASDLDWLRRPRRRSGAIQPVAAATSPQVAEVRAAVRRKASMHCPSFALIGELFAKDLSWPAIARLVGTCDFATRASRHGTRVLQAWKRLLLILCLFVQAKVYHGSP